MRVLGIHGVFLCVGDTALCGVFCAFGFVLIPQESVIL